MTEQSPIHVEECQAPVSVNDQDDESIINVRRYPTVQWRSAPDQKMITGMIEAIRRL
ncbi:MAG: hypothetical protein AAF629_13525 [Chloroflexota bacterium]